MCEAVKREIEKMKGRGEVGVTIDIQIIGGRSFSDLIFPHIYTKNLPPFLDPCKERK